MDAHARLFVAKLRRKNRASRVYFVSDVDEPVDDGRYITLTFHCEGEPPIMVACTIENFYVQLKKVAEATMPKLLGRPMH